MGVTLPIQSISRMEPPRRQAHGEEKAKLRESGFFRDFSLNTTANFALVPTVPVGMPSRTLCVLWRSAWTRAKTTQSVEDGIPTRSVGTRKTLRQICGGVQRGVSVFLSASAWRLLASWRFNSPRFRRFFAISQAGDSHLRSDRLAFGGGPTLAQGQAGGQQKNIADRAPRRGHRHHRPEVRERRELAEPERQESNSDRRTGEQNTGSSHRVAGEQARHGTNSLDR